MTVDEYAVYSALILLADHRSGVWRGCAEALKDWMKWSIRQCQIVLKSLREKGYITGTPTRGRGRYIIRITKYFPKKAHGGAPLSPEGAQGCALSPKKAHGGATYQEEVLTRRKTQEKTRAETRRSLHSPELVRQIEAKQVRLSKEEAGKREGKIMEVPIGDGKPKEGYVEFTRLREENRIPKAITWAVWKKMSSEERAKAQVA